MSNLGMAVNKNPSREQIVAGIEDDDFLFTPKGVRESADNIKQPMEQEIYQLEREIQISKEKARLKRKEISKAKLSPLKENNLPSIVKELTPKTWVDDRNSNIFQNKQALRKSSEWMEEEPRRKSRDRSNNS